MRATEMSSEAQAAATTVRDRILGDTYGSKDEALVFAASSIIREITAARYNGETVERRIDTERGSYTLQGTRVHSQDGVHPVVIVFTEPLFGAMPAPKVDAIPDPLRVRFNLTRKEAKVAALLTAQLTNGQIAAQLCISTHTARHHTQSVLSKLGVRSRREVAGKLSAASAG